MDIEAKEIKGILWKWTEIKGPARKWNGSITFETDLTFMDYSFATCCWKNRYNVQGCTVYTLGVAPSQ